MKIFVDARMMGATVSRGIGRVIEELLPRLIRLLPTVEWVILLRYPEQRRHFVGLETRITVIEQNVPWYGFAEQLAVPFWILRHRPNHCLFFHWNIPVLLAWLPFGCFIHDLLLFHQPDSAKISTRTPLLAKIKQFVQRRVVGLVAGYACFVAVPTEYVGRDVIRYFPHATGRVKVVGEGVTSVAVDEQRKTSANPYCLMVGSAYPHKRLDLALRSWKRVVEQHPRHELVIIGEDDVFMERYRELVRQESIPQVRFLGRVENEVLASWYAQADLFVFASEEEGFGLPPLEALLANCPVLASDASCIPEVLPKQAVRFFRSGDQDDMIRVWNDALSHRHELVAELPLAQQDIRIRHSWDVSAKRLAGLLLTS